MWGKMKTALKTRLFVFCVLQLVRVFFCIENIRKTNGQVLNKPQIRLLLRNPGGTFLQIQTDMSSDQSLVQKSCTRCNAH